MKLKNHRRFLPVLIPLFLISVFYTTGCGLFREHEFSVGLIADCQYSRDADAGLRKYALSEKKLKDCIADLNSRDLAFVIQLGDFIDNSYANFDVVLPIFNQLEMPGFHVLGNHDFAVADDKKRLVPKKLHMSGRYYDFMLHDWHFIVLDGNDISFHAYPSDSEDFKKAEDYYRQRGLDSPKWNGAIGDQQMNWLRSVLEKSQQANEPVILFSHFPVYPDDIHNLWNAPQIIDLIEQYPVVRAFISGHNHAGGYRLKKNIHYVTLKGMVESEQTSYAVMTLTKSKIEINGYGREQSRRLMIN